jgi:hypothetical protein
MTLTTLQSVLRPGETVADQGESVARSRRYLAGHFDDHMSAEMRRLANIPRGDRFGANHCETVVSTQADRLVVSDIQSNRPDAQDWLDGVLDANRFDGLQLSVHRATLRDGITFVLVDWDGQRVRLTHEPAFDGVAGVLAVYRGRTMVGAVKAWHITQDTFADTLRINLYYADRILKYESVNGGEPVLLDDSAWTAGGVALVAFINRPDTSDGRGQSELDNVIPLQNMLVRTHYSLTVAAELTAFKMYVAKGFAAPAELSIGMVLEIAPDGLNEDQTVDFYALEGSDITPYLATADHIIEQIYDVSKTPYPRVASTASGEALKQREVGLLGKVRACQVGFGNSWEDVAALAYRVESAYSLTPPPDPGGFVTRWHEATVRDNERYIETILRVRDLIGDEAARRLLAPVLGV